MDATPDFSSLSDKDLEQSLTSHTARLNAANFEQLMMIAEFDRRNAYGHEGTRSCAHWLNWRCGISFNAAREQIRVAHALQLLPKTCEAFAQGQLSFSKARAITRIGTPKKSPPQGDNRNPTPHDNPPTNNKNIVGPMHLKD